MMLSPENVGSVATRVLVLSESSDGVSSSWSRRPGLGVADSGSTNYMMTRL